MNHTDSAIVLGRKLPEAELRLLAEKDSDEIVSVIVEPKLPSQKVVPIRRSGRASQSHFLMKVAAETQSRQRQNMQTVEETRSFLQSLTGGTPHWLNSARAFVVNAAPLQLKEMAQFPLIKTIRLNRRLKKTG
jgi:hypothetical protein